MYVLAALSFPQQGVSWENEGEEKAMGEGENIHTGITSPKHIEVSVA